MRRLFKNSFIYYKGKIEKADMLVDNGRIVSLRKEIVSQGDDEVFDFSDLFIFPGLIDVHTHLREPGFFYKESILTGSEAAAASGYTDICTMPNLDPVPDSPEHLKCQTDIIKRDAVIRVHPYASLTIGQLGTQPVNIPLLAKKVVAFSDDGRGVQDESVMMQIMASAAKAGVIVAGHCEVEALRKGGCIHEGDYAKAHGFAGISSECEYAMIDRDVRLAEMTGCKYHVCHVSTKEGVSIIRDAKRRGVNVSCETAPHYLMLDDGDLCDDGRFKMNPPLRDRSDRNALIEGICDGTIDMIATDHAPHSLEEKSGGLRKSLMGVSGLEAAFPILYTGLVKNGVITLEKLISLMSIMPRRRFKIGSDISVGKKAGFCVFDLGRRYTIKGENFISKGKITPFEGKEVYGKCIMTVIGDKIVWTENLIKR